jgi:hypothetical protein
LNDETIGLLGGFAYELLREDRFLALQDMFKQQVAADFLQTLPQEVKKREGIHAAYTGFSEFTRLLHQFAEAYAALYKQQNEEITALDAHQY